jgi:hypothetical protein
MISMRPGWASGRSRRARIWEDPVSRNCPGRGSVSTVTLMVRNSSGPAGSGRSPSARRDAQNLRGRPGRPSGSPGRRAGDPRCSGARTPPAGPGCSCRTVGPVRRQGQGQAWSSGRPLSGHLAGRSVVIWPPGLWSSGRQVCGHLAAIWRVIIVRFQPVADEVVANSGNVERPVEHRWRRPGPEGVAFAPRKAELVLCLKNALEPAQFR